MAGGLGSSSLDRGASQDPADLCWWPGTNGIQGTSPEMKTPKIHLRHIHKGSTIPKHEAIHKTESTYPYAISKSTAKEKS